MTDDEITRRECKAIGDAIAVELAKATRGRNKSLGQLATDAARMAAERALADELLEDDLTA